jgi:hypothetical protein
VNTLGKAFLIAPAYLSVAWVLMVSYQLFTQTAVTTVIDSLQGTLPIPLLMTWLTSRIDIIVFIYAFSWVFVLSSIIPQLIIGRERSVSVQFIICLTLTLTAFVLVDILKGYGLDLTNPTLLYSNPYTSLFTNPYFAALYLATPYIIMISIDLHNKKKRNLKNLIDSYSNQQKKLKLNDTNTKNPKNTFETTNTQKNQEDTQAEES